jgi:short-subunit dehydrogenase
VIDRAAFARRYGPWALVAGASEGIGAAFARGLAARGLSLVLVARRAGPLEELAASLRAEFSVEVHAEPLDLAAPDLPARAAALVEGREVGLLVYNAAHSAIGDFLERPLDEKLRTLDVNCRGPVIFADVLGRPMAARGRGGMVLMASLAASQGSPLVATYAATKAFNLILAESLWDELRARGVDVIACRAGATRTPNLARSGVVADPPMVKEPDEVAEAALRSLGRAPSVVPGFGNRLVALAMARLFPRRLAITTIGNATRKLYGRR